MAFSVKMLVKTLVFLIYIFLKMARGGEESSDLDFFRSFLSRKKNKEILKNEFNLAGVIKL